MSAMVREALDRLIKEKNGVKKITPYYPYPPY